MANYNLTFNEAIAAGASEIVLQNDFYKHLLYRFSDGVWEDFCIDDVDARWDVTSFDSCEIAANWRIVPNEEESDYSFIVEHPCESILVSDITSIPDRVKKEIEEMKDEANSYYTLHEQRISALEEKLEKAESLIESLIDKTVIAGADIKTLYGICDNHEEVIVSCEEKLANFKIYIDDLYELINGDEAIFETYNLKLDGLRDQVESIKEKLKENRRPFQEILCSSKKSELPESCGGTE